MIRGGLQEPGDSGTYDAETSLAGLDFGPEFLNPFFEPTARNWRQLLAAYHEWAHHYQYHATTYGYLYRMVSNAQLLLANGVLRVARQERGRRRVSLPLTARNEPLTAADNPIDLNLRLITMLQTQRDGILGYGQHVSMDDMQEWIFACKAMGQLFGGPLAFVIEPTFMPEPPKIRYRVTDLLETHAHVLSSMWLMLAVDRMDGDRHISREAVRLANEQLVGPYAAFTQFVPGIAGTPAEQLKLFCALAEIALNPVGIHRHPKQSWETVMTPLYTSWFPVVRMESMMSWAMDGDLAWPGGEWPGIGAAIIAAVSEASQQHGNPPGAFLPEADGMAAGPALQRVVDRVALYAGVDDDVPPELLAFQLDALAKLCAAEELKQQVPLLLSGVVIEELRLLVSRLAGPTARCNYDGGSRTLIGACTGLMRLDLLSPGTVVAGSDAIVNDGAPIAHALHLLLLHSRAELEARADQPLLALKKWTLRTVLAEHYGMALSDFD